MLVGHLLLVAQAFVWTPLGEVGGELGHLAAARHWAQHGRPPDLRQRPPRTLDEGARPPLAHAAFALGLLAADAEDLVLLARSNPDINARNRAILLHGADEIPPYSPALRRVHAARLVGVLFSLLAILGTYCAAGRLMPGARLAPVGAAAFLGFNPAFASFAGAFHDVPAAAACVAWGAALLCALSVRAAPATSRRLVGTGLLVGLGLLASWSTATLLAGAFVLLLQRRRRDGALRFGEVLLGVLLLAGPFLAWNTMTYGDPLAAAYILPAPERTALPRDVPAVLAAWRVFETLCQRAVSEWGHQVFGGGELVSTWTTALLAGLVGLLWQCLRVPGAVARGPLQLLLVMLGAHLASLLVTGVDVAEPRAPVLLPVAPLAACLVAAGARTWIGPRVGALVLAALLGQALIVQSATLRHAYWPLNRAADPHFVSVDVVGYVPDERRMPFLSIVEPLRGATLVEPPVLRWEPGHLDARFTVHLSYKGLTTTRRTWEDEGRVLHDRYEIPAEIWYGLPPGVPLQITVLQLPTRGELAATPLPDLSLRSSLPWTLHRRREPTGE